MSIIDTILSVITPYECLGCGAEGELACPACLNEFLMKTEECYRCRQPSPDSLTCDACLEISGIQRAQAAVIYKGLPKDLIWQLKSSGAQAASKIMTKYMRPLATPNVNLIVPAPTATSRVRQRGYDQALLLARQLSKSLNIPWSSCLVRDGQAHQVGSAKQNRLLQLQEAFRAKNPVLLRGANVLVVDDVITTGATIEAIAPLLLAAGATQVEALAFARPRLLK